MIKPEEIYWNCDSFNCTLWLCTTSTTRSLLHVHSQAIHFLPSSINFAEGNFGNCRFLRHQNVSTFLLLYYLPFLQLTSPLGVYHNPNSFTILAVKKVEAEGRGLFTAVKKVEAEGRGLFTAKNVQLRWF